MAKYIVTFSDILNEIEIKGFITMTEKEVERFEELASSISWDFTYPIGEEELFFSSGDDLLSRIEYKEISNEEYKIIKKVFSEDFGIFIGEEFLEGIIGETEDSEEEEDEEGFTNDDDEDDY